MVTAFAAAVQELQKKGYQGLVVIVDDLDKMITRPHESAGCSTTEYLLVHRSAQLTAFQCHLVYTLPIELAYSHHEPTIKRLYGGHLPVVPITKIATPPPKSKTHAPGMKRFREMIAARLTAVGAGDRDLFHSDKVRDDLIKLTGGQPTELMTLIREASSPTVCRSARWACGVAASRRCGAIAGNCAAITGRCWTKSVARAK